MREASNRTEVRKEPEPSFYLPLDFAERAPTDQGPDELMKWLDTKLHPAVKEVADSHRSWHPEVEALDGIIEDAMEHLYNDKIKFITQLLWRYADYKHRIIFNCPARIERHKRAEASGVEWKKRLRSMTVERLEDRRIALEQVIRALNLDREKEIIDDLFERSAAIPSESGAILEGKLLPKNT